MSGTHAPSVVDVPAPKELAVRVPVRVLNDLYLPALLSDGRGKEEALTPEARALLSDGRVLASEMFLLASPRIGKPADELAKEAGIAHVAPGVAAKLTGPLLPPLDEPWRDSVLTRRFRIRNRPISLETLASILKHFGSRPARLEHLFTAVKDFRRSVEKDIVLAAGGTVFPWGVVGTGGGVYEIPYLSRTPDGDIHLMVHDAGSPTHPRLHEWMTFLAVCED